MKTSEAQALFLAQKRVFIGRFVGEEITEGNGENGPWARHVVNVYSDKDVLNINIRHPKTVNRATLVPALALKEFEPVVVHLQDVSGNEYGSRLTGTVLPLKD